MNMNITAADSIPEGSAHPQMLTIRETAGTGILPEAALRTLVKQGKVPGIYVGRKFLVNYDRLCDWLNGAAETARG